VTGKEVGEEYVKGIVCSERIKGTLALRGTWRILCNMKIETLALRIQ